MTIEELIREEVKQWYADMDRAEQERELAARKADDKEFFYAFTTLEEHITFSCRFDLERMIEAECARA